MLGPGRGPGRLASVLFLAGSLVLKTKLVHVIFFRFHTEQVTGITLTAVILDLNIQSGSQTTNFNH